MVGFSANARTYSFVGFLELFVGFCARDMAVLILHSDSDQIVPIADSAARISGTHTATV
jgi:hypothetical protein